MANPAAISSQKVPMLRLTHEPIDYHQVNESVRSPHCGAVVLFLGTVRDITGDRLTTHLEYHAYETMALSEMQTIEKELRERFDIGALAMVHRLGRLDVGEISVAIAVSAPHRDTAYAASRFAIDTLKGRLPIWKKEHDAQGETEWIGG